MLKNDEKNIYEKYVEMALMKSKKWDEIEDSYYFNASKMAWR
jgi:hypothetical protein